MSRTWLTSDSHLMHTFVAGLRGYPSADLHDAALIDTWNQIIDPDDLVWHLGDVGLGQEDAMLERARQLNGHKQLVTGNHDKCWPGHRDSRKHQKKWLEVFESVQAFARIRFNGQVILLSHFPYEGDHTREDRYTQYRLRDEGEWLFHGHTHSDNQYGGFRQIHVGLDAWGQMPVSLEQAAALIIPEPEVRLLEKQAEDRSEWRVCKQ